MERQSDNGLLDGLSRRGFLKKAGSGVAIAGLSGQVATPSFAQQLQVPDPPGKKLGWAIVGLGRLSINQILPAFAKCERSKVVAFVTGDRAKGEKLAARYGVNPKSIYNYQNYESLRDNPEVDIVYIVLPNSMHAEYTIRAAKIGKHVLTEKPMANTPKDCEEMIKACREANRKLMVAYRVRSECVMNDKEPLTPGEEGLRDLRIMMAIYEAARAGKTVKL